MSKDKVSSYKIVSDHKPDELDKKVNDKIREGWQLGKGSTFVTPLGLICREMVRYKKVGRRL